MAFEVRRRHTSEPILMNIDLSKLAEPFDRDDIEWRVSRAGRSNGKVFCRIICYITARAIQKRLDDVCGPTNWRNEPLTVHEAGQRTFAFQTGISIRIGDEWVTKWDVAEPTQVEAAKGGFSGAMKRAGAQWGIGRYLYHLEETFAEVSESGGKGWTYAKLQKEGGSYYWRPPANALPWWALPKEPEVEVTVQQLNDLKRKWKESRGDGGNPAELRDGFAKFVSSVVGEFPVADHTCWTSDALSRCIEQLNRPVSIGVSPDVPFEE